MRDEIKIYLLKHSEGYELDATRCREAHDRIASLEKQVEILMEENAYLISRLARSESERFSNSIHTRRHH